MDPLDIYRRLQAADRRRAVPTTTMRHVHLSQRPLVVAAYHLAGELGAPLAMMWGTSPDPAAAGFLAVPEPRNREQRFAALERFGDALDAYLAPYQDLQTVPRVSRGTVVGTEQVCADAPQLVFPNTATAKWLCGVVGRFTRYLPTDGDDPVPETVRRTGQNLTFFGQQRQMPGSCIALAATDVLTGHYATGQLDGETENLTAVLGWVDPAEGLDGPAAAALAELTRPPAGPMSDPNWDADDLQRLIADYHDAADEPRRLRAVAALEAEAREQLQPAWLDTWRALDQVRHLPAARHVAYRWDGDRRAWARHAARVQAGAAFFRRVPDALQAARTLNRTEELTDDVAAQMALDDPAVMLRAVARGDAAAGVVHDVDPLARGINGNGRSVVRPLLTVDADLPFDRPAGTELHLADEPTVRAELLGAAQAPDGRQRLTFRIVAGALNAATRDKLPRPGQRVVLSQYGAGAFFPGTLPDQIPWTHRLPEPAGADA
jgi:hypothetical protein